MIPNKETIKSAVIDVLRNVHDPEIPVNIYDRGREYGKQVTD